MEKLTEKQRVFLTQYEGLLQEVEEAAVYAGDCYVRGDEDIGDRLLASVSKGLLPYHPENMTLVSIVTGDREMEEALAAHFQTVQTAASLEEDPAPEGQRYYFVQEFFLPRLKAWREQIEKRRRDLHAAD
ncbi:hypothetical protein [Alkalicoccus urumqiensis]|uniref:DUF8042 domain-containing protein n=1 Tax=Alkalicoccus urumqiensis TaxID=1548213 RepID=A0A2P6MH65_ALKUR|nr:hypothetical protein [Alkalicoccus urumqiensis]PRO65626.1 hypothetical protein C6I21_08875 [Alkalicoccus urumqiensis]